MKIAISNILNSYLFIQISVLPKKCHAKFTYFQTDKRPTNNKSKVKCSYDEYTYKLCGCKTEIACKPCKITTLDIPHKDNEEKNNNNNNNC